MQPYLKLNKIFLKKIITTYTYTVKEDNIYIFLIIFISSLVFKLLATMKFSIKYHANHMDNISQYYLLYECLTLFL